jgi:hypothetical protein
MDNPMRFRIALKSAISNISTLLRCAGNRGFLARSTKLLATDNADTKLYFILVGERKSVK